MSEKPTRSGIPELQDTIDQLRELADKANEQLGEIDNDFPDEVWEYAASEVARTLKLSCESTMDGRILVEVEDNVGNVIKKQRFDLFDVFALSTFESPDPSDRAAMIAQIKKVLAFVESPKDPE